MRKLLLILITLASFSVQAQGLGMGMIIHEENVGFSMSVDRDNLDLSTTGIEAGLYGRQPALAEGYHSRGSCSAYSCSSSTFYSNGLTADGEGGWFMAGRYLLDTNKGKIVLAAGPAFHNVYNGGYKQSGSIKPYAKVGYTHTRRYIGYEVGASTVGAYVGMNIKF